jgi:hypothetical protein
MSPPEHPFRCRHNDNFLNEKSISDPHLDLFSAGKTWMRVGEGEGEKESPRPVWTVTQAVKFSLLWSQ